MSFHVYIPKLSDDRYHVGHADDLERRVRGKRKTVRCSMLSMIPFQPFMPSEVEALR